MGGSGFNVHDLLHVHCMNDCDAPLCVTTNGQIVFILCGDCESIIAALPASDEIRRMAEAHDCDDCEPEDPKLLN